MSGGRVSLVDGKVWRDCLGWKRSPLSAQVRIAAGLLFSSFKQNWKCESIKGEKKEPRKSNAESVLNSLVCHNEINSWSLESLIFY